MMFRETAGLTCIVAILGLFLCTGSNCDSSVSSDSNTPVVEKIKATSGFVWLKENSEWYVVPVENISHCQTSSKNVYVYFSKGQQSNYVVVHDISPEFVESVIREAKTQQNR